MVNCGLVTNKNEPVPLKSIEVNLQTEGHVATVSSTLQYVNEEQGPVEALFVFPMTAEAAVCHFSAKIADREVVAEVQEKEKARELYDEALSSGQQGFLLEESEESTDVFRLSVGSLPPGQSAAVTFVYVTELSVQADYSLRFCLPAVLNPRYSPPGMSGGIVSEITPGSAQIPYSLSLTVHLSSPNPITAVKSQCPLEPLVFLNTDHTRAKVNLCAGHKFDRDVELFLYYQNSHQPTAVVEAGVTTAQPGSLMGDRVVMLSFYPEFPEGVVSSCGEFVFVVDRSGSMSWTMHNGPNTEARITSARNTLLLLLKSLPMGCYFNIYGFGSHYKSFFSNSVKYSQETLDQAVQRVKQMQADMGGTEILQPLKHIYSQPCIPNHPRQVFIFTDGAVWNTKEVLQLVGSNAESHRCFSFGIGEGASTALITGMAQEGSGHAQFITGTDRMQSKVMQSLRFALQPAVMDISEVWSVPEGMSVSLLSPPVKVLFHGQRALIYAQLKGEAFKSSDCKGTITLQYRLADQHVTNTLGFSIKPAENTGLTIHRLAARSRIRSLEKEQQAEGGGKEELRARVVELSVQAGVSSSHTAFVAIHKGSGEAVKGPLLKRNVPVSMMNRAMSHRAQPVMMGASMIGSQQQQGLPASGSYIAIHKGSGKAVKGPLLKRNVPVPMMNRAMSHRAQPVMMGASMIGSQQQQGLPASGSYIAIHKGSGKAVKGPLLKRNVPVPMMNRAMSHRAQPVMMGASMIGSQQQQGLPASGLMNRAMSHRAQPVMMGASMIGSQQQQGLPASGSYIAIHKGSGKAVKGPLLKRNVPVPMMSRAMSHRAQHFMMGNASMLQVPQQQQGLPASGLSCMAYGGPLLRSGSAPMPQLLGSLGLPPMGSTNKGSLSPPARRMKLDVDFSDTADDINDHLLQLISLQEASGCWEMKSTLAQVFGKSMDDVAKQMPAQVEPGIWATVLALIWLHGFKMDAHDEWQFVAIKATSWIRSRKVVNLSECVLAANTVLQCQVKEEALGF
ncbi:von Willebrand factor A domain-containing protein 5A-like [Brachyhypopomus gauderio]|uniref:von Willebrand factor A domain-containing protein 5A-like n=1 Tax=Brachyhypopomus gauderio TaxID=698409 RepID=UPI00404111F5